jgi:hypothetical protein
MGNLRSIPVITPAPAQAPASVPANDIFEKLAIANEAYSEYEKGGFYKLIPFLQDKFSKNFSSSFGKHRRRHKRRKSKSIKRTGTKVNIKNRRSKKLKT